MKANYCSLAIVLVASSFLYSFTSQTKPWVVPDKFKNMTNPVKTDAESVKAGKVLWTKHCQSCHGKTGLGDGTKAAQLDTEMEDFSTGVVQKQSDGELFFKTQEGRDDMPSFKKKIADEEEVWQLVNYIRSLKSK